MLMVIALLAARLTLVLVFMVAGVSKLGNPSGNRATLEAFGAPVGMTRWLGPMLPVLELVAAAGLLAPPLAWIGAMLAGLLLTTFTVAIAFNLARGRRPDCNCFGQIETKPIGPVTLVRNLALTALAVLLVSVGPARAGSWRLIDLPAMSAAMMMMSAFAILTLALLGLMALLLLQMLRQQGRMLLRLDGLEALLERGGMVAAGDSAPKPPAQVFGLPVGAAAPDFRLAAARGGFVSLGDLTSPGRPLLLVFTNPGCGPCLALAPEVEGWRRQHRERLDIVRVSEGAAADNKGPGQVLLQKTREVADAYQCWGTPGAVLVNPDGTIGSPVAQGADAIRALVARAVEEVADRGAGPADRRGQLSIGERPPPFMLDGPGGSSFSSSDVLGQETLLLFWNPDCGFCQRMLSDLRRWEADPPRGAPRLVLASSASEDRNRALGLTSLILPDAQTFGAVFGAHGTPMAVLLDENGRLASGVAAGGDQVMELANGTARKSRAALSA